jgi:hypothetical protein
MADYSCTAGFAGLPSAPCMTTGGTFEPLSGCEPCTAGRYADVDGLALCIRCPSGKYMSSSTVGSVSSTDCIGCGAGKYATTIGAIAESSCIDCTAGKYTNTVGQSQCIDCSPGFYESLTGSSGCDSCSRGRYSASVGATTCVCCPAGKDSQQNSTSLDDCVDCSAGKWLGAAACVPDNSMRPCTDCMVDTYGVTPGATSEAAACIDCPAHASTVGRTGVPELLGCWCIEGYQLSFGYCELCPVNT